MIINRTDELKHMISLREEWLMHEIDGLKDLSNRLFLIQANTDLYTITKSAMMSSVRAIKKIKEELYGLKEELSLGQNEPSA